MPTRFALRGPVVAMPALERSEGSSSSLCRREGGDAATARRRRYRKLAECKGRSPVVVCRGKGRPRRNGHHALRSLRQVRGFGGGLVSCTAARGFHTGRAWCPFPGSFFQFRRPVDHHGHSSRRFLHWRHDEESLPVAGDNVLIPPTQIFDLGIKQELRNSRFEL